MLNKSKLLVGATSLVLFLWIQAAWFDLSLTSRPPTPQGDTAPTITELKLKVASNYTQGASSQAPSSRAPEDEASSRVLLVSSVGRSGSTFLGELLAQRNNTVFMFEPELFLQQWTSTGVTPTTSLRLLNKMFSCQFSLMWSKWARDRRNVWEAEDQDVCQEERGFNYYVCLKQVCERNLNKVIKVIKMRVNWTEEMIKDRDIKVVHLVRDPRASFLSLTQLHMLQADYKVWCPRIQQDLEAVGWMRTRFPQRFLSVKYEDVCRDPWGIAGKLWEFVSGHNATNLPPSWSRFLTLHTKGSKVDTYGTSRNTEKMVDAWRWQIRGKLLTEVEQYCDGVIDMLGHTKFHTLQNARNVSISLEKSP